MLFYYLKLLGNQLVIAWEFWDLMFQIWVLLFEELIRFGSVLVDIAESFVDPIL